MFYETVLQTCRDFGPYERVLVRLFARVDSFVPQTVFGCRSSDGVAKKGLVWTGVSAALPRSIDLLYLVTPAFKTRVKLTRFGIGYTQSQLSQ